MNILELVKILRNKFTKKKFFVRVYHIQDDIIIYNDIDIILKYNIKLFSNIDKMVNQIIYEVKKKIDEKYSVTKDMISIIIPNYNNGIFLKNTITKILENTYDNIEIIIVDDKSTDNSIEIIENFKNDKIKIYKNNVNSGTYYSRNRGILKSKGEYILNIDGDDYIDKTYIENMINGLKNNSNIWGYGKHFERVYLNDDLNIIRKKKSLSYNILFKRKLFNYLGFFQNSRFGADTEFIFRAKIYNYPIKYDHHNNIIEYHANTLKNKNLTEVISLNKRKEYVKQLKRNIYSNNYIEMAFFD
jgi:glycosyltransferase involved in cell wall biosynthesis